MAFLTPEDLRHIRQGTRHPNEVRPDCKCRHCTGQCLCNEPRPFEQLRLWEGAP